MEKKRKATDGQREQINGMLLSGLIGFDEAEEIIRNKRLPDPAPNFLVTEWENAYPGKGQKIASYLGPFYYWVPQFVPPVPDFETQVREAVFWHPIATIVTEENGPFKRTLPRTLKRYRREDDDRPYNMLQKGLRLREYNQPNPFRALQTKIGIRRCEGLEEQFMEVLLAVIGCLLSGQEQEAERFRPLLRLYRDGNYPYAFDKNNNLLVLVGDAT